MKGGVKDFTELKAPTSDDHASGTVFEFALMQFYGTIHRGVDLKFEILDFSVAERA